jgi:hypothetical protein
MLLLLPSSKVRVTLHKLALTKREPESAKVGTAKYSSSKTSRIKARRTTRKEKTVAYFQHFSLSIK